MVFGSREMVSGHRSMVLPGSDMPSALGLVIMMLWCGYHVDNAVDDDDVDGDADDVDVDDIYDDDDDVDSIL